MKVHARPNENLNAYQHMKNMNKVARSQFVEVSRFIALEACRCYAVGMEDL